MTFSATDAAFEGFRVVRRTPMTIVWWSLFYLAFTALLFALAGGSFLQMMQAAQALEGNPNPTQADLAPFMGAYAVIFAVVLPISIVVGSVLYGAANRAVLDPSARRFGFLRLGMDEVRIFVVTLVLTIVVVVGLLVLAALAGVVTGFAGSASTGAGVGVGILAFLAVFAVAVFFGIRLSLAVPITFAEKRIAIFDSWRLTKGHFWPLLGMGLIAVVMVIIINILGSLVTLPLTLAFGGINQIAALEGADMATVMRTMAPAIIVYVISTSIVSALQLAVLYSPFAAAYRDIKGVSRPDTAETFA